MGGGFRRASWERALRERFREVEPWLLPRERLAETVACEHSGRNGCAYRVVEHASGKFMGVCDEGRCARRVFERAELVEYTVDFARLRRELARVLGLEADSRDPPHPCLLPVGRWRAGQETLGVVLVGGNSPEVIERLLREIWQEGRLRHIVLLPSDREPRESAKAFLNRVEWPHYCLEERLELLPRNLRWRPGEEVRWRAFLEGVSPLDTIERTLVRPVLDKLARSLEPVGERIAQVVSENELLGKRLVDQLAMIAEQVDPTYFRKIMAVLVHGSVRAAARAEGIPNSTYYGYLKEQSARGGLHRKMLELVKIRRRAVGRRKLGSFKGDLLLHQGGSGAGGDTALLEDVVRALRDQNPDNWEDVRDEVLDLLKG